MLLKIISKNPIKIQLNAKGNLQKHLTKQPLFTKTIIETGALF